MIGARFALGNGQLRILPETLSRLRISFLGPSSPIRFMTDSSKGQVAGKTPSKVHLEAGKTYKWCACGLSAKQPLCDGSHKNSPLGIKPIELKATETKDGVFCNCKQTHKGPFCDGTHKKL